MFRKMMSGALAAGLLFTGQAAFADPPGWAKHRHHERKHEHKHDHHHGRHDHYDYARVVDVDPIVRRVRVSLPREQCWTETRYQEVEHRESAPHGRAAGSMIAGGVIGAAIGNQIGSGDGRRAATVAGAIIGSAIGHDVAARRNARYTETVYREERPYEVERCSVRYDEDYEEHIDGYRVTYVYGGRHYTTRMPYDPGHRVRVRVDAYPEVCD